MSVVLHRATAPLMAGRKVRTRPALSRRTVAGNARLPRL